MKLMLSLLLLLTVAFPLAFSDPSASALSPADLAWKEANSALEKRQFQNAQKKFDDFLRRYLSDPRAQEARVYSAICDYRQKRIAKALDSWNRLASMELMQERSSPALLLALRQLAAHYGSERNMREYEKILGHLASAFPDHEFTMREHVNAARMKVKDGDFGGAAELYGRVSARLEAADKKDWDVARVLAERGGSVAMLLRAAEEHLTEDSVSIAERLYREILKREPAQNEKHEALTKLGWALYMQDKWQESEKLWQSVIKEAPSGSEWLARCRWHMIQVMAGPRDQMSKAIELCELQIREFPDHPEGERAMLTRAWLYWTRKDWAKARKGFEELTAAYPHTANAPPIKRYLADCDEGLSK